MGEGSAGRQCPPGELMMPQARSATTRLVHVTVGYWNRPEETAKVLRDSWLRSGDLARCDADGG